MRSRRDREHLADLFESARELPSQTQTHADDAFFAGIELLQHGGHRLLQAEADARNPDGETTP